MQDMFAVIKDIYNNPRIQEARCPLTRYELFILQVEFDLASTRGQLRKFLMEFEWDAINIARRFINLLIPMERRRHYQFDDRRFETPDLSLEQVLSLPSLPQPLGRRIMFVLLEGMTRNFSLAEVSFKLPDVPPAAIEAELAVLEADRQVLRQDGLYSVRL